VEWKAWGGVPVVVKVDESLYLPGVVKLHVRSLRKEPVPTWTVHTLDFYAFVAGRANERIDIPWTDKRGAEKTLTVNVARPASTSADDIQELRDVGVVQPFADGEIVNKMRAPVARFQELLKDVHQRAHPRDDVHMTGKTSGATDGIATVAQGVGVHGRGNAHDGGATKPAPAGDDVQNLEDAVPHKDVYAPKKPAEAAKHDKGAAARAAYPETAGGKMGAAAPGHATKAKVVKAKVNMDPASDGTLSKMQGDDGKGPNNGEGPHALRPKDGEVPPPTLTQSTLEQHWRPQNADGDPCAPSVLAPGAQESTAFAHTARTHAQPGRASPREGSFSRVSAQMPACACTRVHLVCGLHTTHNLCTLPGCLQLPGRQQESGGRPTLLAGAC